MSIIKKFWNNRSLFTKIALYYTITVVCLAIFIIIFTTKQVTEEVTDLNISLHNNILNNISNYMEDIHTDINNLTKIIAYEGNLQNPLYSFLYSKDSNNPIPLDQEFSRFFLDFNNSRYNIASIIVLNNTDDAPHFWSSNNIGLVNNFPFSKQDWYSTVKDSARQMTVFKTNEPNYLINFNANKQMITFARNVYDVQNISELRDIGTIVVNLQVDTFEKMFESLVSDFNGQFYILAEDGTVIFDYSGKFTGQHHPPFHNLVSQFNSKEGNQYVKLDGSKFASYKKIPHFQWTAVTVIPETQISSGIDKINSTIIYIVVVAIASAFLMFLFMFKRFFKRLQLILKSIHRIEKGNFEPVARTSKRDEIEQIAVSIDNMRLKLIEFINKSYISNIKQQEAELRTLQMQINPHFLYNTLESIRMKASLNNDAEVADMIKILADLFRWNVQDKHMVISLEEEIEFVTAYLDIQKIRFGDRLQYAIHIPSELYGYGILKLLLQPIVENTFIHGFEQGNYPHFLEIKAVLSDKELIISIMDNGIGMSAENIIQFNKKLQHAISTNYEYQSTEQIGLTNVHERINRLFHSFFGLHIASNEMGGITVTVRLPAYYTGEMRDYVQNDYS
ncbi:sensor histidine kinase [Paenibacillus yanchengensis]|uniref:Sensor histidine kinase n=1 Tax=Paenibacillus yanchengensis TaxID=2035833 RepID=A0ABW4YPE9_9BACL